jgi:bis(5'-adenosyl)-triphosphatase
MSGFQSGCPFCGEAAESIAFAHSRSFLAICNAAPILPGHSLVIPKRHAHTVLELGSSELSEMTIFAKEVTAGLMHVFGATGFNWTIQQGQEGGQTVPHLHLHLIPRFRGDLPNPGDWYPILKRSESEMIDSAKRAKISAPRLTEIARTVRNKFDFQSAVSAVGLV